MDTVSMGLKDVRWSIGFCDADPISATVGTFADGTEMPELVVSA